MMKDYSLNPEDKKKRIQAWWNECNFLSNDGSCLIGSSGGWGNSWNKKCDFEDCIFIKIKNRQDYEQNKNGRTKHSKKS